jgi:hypothetical protein
MAGKGPSLTYVNKDTLNGVTGRSWGIEATLCVCGHGIVKSQSGLRLANIFSSSCRRFRISIPAKCGGYQTIGENLRMGGSRGLLLHWRLGAFSGPTISFSRRLPRSELRVEGGWNLVLVEHLVNRGLTDRAVAEEAYAKVVGFNYLITHFSGSVIVAALRVSNFRTARSLLSRCAG